MKADSSGTRLVVNERKLEAGLLELDATMLAFDDIDETVRQAVSRFPHFNTFPHPAKLGLLDMVYNLGIGKIFAPAIKNGFPVFRAAVRRRIGEWQRTNPIAQACKQVATRSFAAGSWTPLEKSQTL